MLDLLYEWGWTFLIYAFLGWIAEVAFAALKTGKFVNRGFLNGPLCPIYGFGMVAVAALLSPVRDRFLLLFFGGALVTSLLEYATGYVLEKVFHDKWWDYSDRRFNLHGYVCLEFSVMWGFGCVLIMQNVHPLVEKLVSWLTEPAGMVAFWILAAGMTADICDTVSTILKLNRRVRAIDETAAAIHRLSDEIGELVATGAIGAKESADGLKEKGDELKQRSDEIYADMRQRSDDFYADIKQRSDEIYADMRQRSDDFYADMKQRSDDFNADLRKKREEYDGLMARYQKLLHEKTRGRRLMKAFPEARSTRYREALENLKESWKERNKDSGENK